MDTATIIAVAQFVLGGFCVVLWSNYQDVKKSAQETSKALAEYKVQVAEKYATADEVKSVVAEINASFEKYGNRMDASLLRIETKLDTKQDRRSGD